MSEVKVNKITPRSGTTVQLGGSGDTVNLPSGSTLTYQTLLCKRSSTRFRTITINGQAVALGGSVLYQKQDQLLHLLHRQQLKTQAYAQS